jgi:competence transcription factor ComK
MSHKPPVIATREVNHNSYKFYFPTYSDPILQKVQLWIIESELEQAIGRARLLLYDFTVYIFSNLPISQAEFIFDELV